MLSLSGSEDGLSTPEKIAEHRDALPGSAEMDAAVADAVAELLGTMP